MIVYVEMRGTEESYCLELPDAPRQGDYVWVNPEGPSPALRNAISPKGFWIHVAQVTWRDGCVWLASKLAQDYEIL